MAILSLSLTFEEVAVVELGLICLGNKHATIMLCSTIPPKEYELALVKSCGRS
jgi:hypothetical protein